MKQDSIIYVAGADTLIGNAILRKLKQEGYLNIYGGSSEAPDLCNSVRVDKFFSRFAPEYVFLSAGKSGGIYANQNHPAELIQDNLQVINNVIHSAYLHKVKKLLYTASSCCYPKHCPQPMREEFLFTGPLESTNEAYATAKIAGIKMCQAYNQQYRANFVSVIPANLFGPGDDFSPEDSHVIAALILKMHEAKKLGRKSVEIWGTGSPRREFIYADDLADACIFIMSRYDSPEPINAGGGSDLSIRELATQVKEVVGYSGEFSFDASKPDGMPIKLLDSHKLREMGWRPKSNFLTALSVTYDWFLRMQQGRIQSSEGKAKQTNKL